MEAIINRLGFEAWADNYIIDKIEGYQGKFPIVIEDDTNGIRFFCDYKDGMMQAKVNAHVPNSGWMTHEQNFKYQIA